MSYTPDERLVLPMLLRIRRLGHGPVAKPDESIPAYEVAAALGVKAKNLPKKIGLYLYLPLKRIGDDAWRRADQMHVGYVRDPARFKAWLIRNGLEQALAAAEVAEAMEKL